MSSFRRKKDSLYALLKRKYSFRRDSNPQSIYYGATFTAELSDLLINGHKSSIYQVQNTLFTNQSSVHNCHKMTNCEQFRTNCCVKIAATLTLANTFVFLIKMWQECYNGRENWVFYFYPSKNELKFCDVLLLLLLKIDKASYVNK